jgi:predicted phosphate transport protein (TIGR00153 family)
VAFSFFPKDEGFFDILEEASENVVKGAKAFRELVSHWSLDSELIPQIREIEHEGDRMTHEVIDRLNRTFITPIDREDIHGLAKELDDVIDIIQATMDRMQLYRIETSSPILVQMVEVLLKSTEVVDKAIKSLRDMKHTRRTLDFCIEVNRLENEGDAIFKTALGELFSEKRDVLDIIRWKEVYEAAEFANDKCEDIANIIEGIIVKNA